MNSSQSQVNSKELSKQLEFVKKQEQLRALGNVTSSKILSADSMIEELLSKKETFQRKKSEDQPKQEQPGVPPWLSSPHPLYERVWTGVVGMNGLADTALFSSLLMSSGLPTEVLGYIWSLSNQTVAGALTQPELYLALALVGMAQAGYGMNTFSAVYQLPQAPVPTLNLSLLPTRAAAPNVYPNPLSVTTLPEPTNFTWVTPQPVTSSGVADKIDISYVSSEPMVSPKLLMDQSKVVPSFSVSHGGKEILKNGNSKKPVENLHEKKSHSKHAGNNFSFSFPSLNESPSHVATKSDEVDPFDDEFTEFQSADFTSFNAPVVNESAKPKQNVADDDDDEFSNFQTAVPKTDDLSVLVVGGKNLASAQNLWVTEKSSELGKPNKNEVNILDMFSNSSTPDLMKPQKDIEQSDKATDKYNVFQDVEEDRFSVFHNPLPDDEDKLSIHSANKEEIQNSEPKSILNHSLFPSLEPSQNLFPSTTLSSTDFITPVESKKDDPTEFEDDEFSNFQTFPVNFDESKVSQGNDANVDRYDVFRTILFEDSSESKPAGITAQDDLTKDSFSNSIFSSGIDFNIPTPLKTRKQPELDLFENISSKQEDEDVKFGDFQESFPVASNEIANVSTLLSSLALSETTSISEATVSVPSNQQTADDKYKALRLLDPGVENSAIDDFGDFLGADFPHSNPPQQSADKQPSIQVRCLEACLNLLKDGYKTLSSLSSPDVVTEVLNDARAKTYLDCLLEVHRVSERIIANMETEVCASERAEIEQVWQSLSSFYSQTQVSPLAETEGGECGVCRSNRGPCPVMFGGLTFHSPCANLYLHCVEPVLPNIATVHSY